MAKKRVEDCEHTKATRLKNPRAGLAQGDIASPPTRSFATTPVDDDPRIPPELVIARSVAEVGKVLGALEVQPAHGTASMLAGQST